MHFTYSEIKEKAARIQFKNQAFINGRYLASQSGETFDYINPATGRVLAKVAACDIIHKSNAF